MELAEVVSYLSLQQDALLNEDRVVAGDVVRAVVSCVVIQLFCGYLNSLSMQVASRSTKDVCLGTNVSVITLFNGYAKSQQVILQRPIFEVFG